MRIPEKTNQEGLVGYAGRLSGLYSKTLDTRTRKLKGQFFTPGQVGRFMAGLFQINGGAIRLLDPGAGTGMLTAAFCERLLGNDESVNLTVDAYENDPGILSLLEKTLDSCKAELEKKGHKVAYNIYEQDFILHNQGCLTKSGLFWESEEQVFYDFAISNPPYYKLNKDSPQSTAMSELISGQPNIYVLFMALSASMVKPEGEMVFITPRSFCSGLYYKRFREWFLRNVRMSNIHIFESRKEIFNKDGVLQENIIVKATKRKSTKGDSLVISLSKNRNLANIERIEVKSAEVIFQRNGETFIRIPTSSLDLDVVGIIDGWPNTLRDFGFEISTGPVIPFRATEYLLPESTGSRESAPLLWMHNMRDMRVVWPLRRNRKESAIRVCDGSRSLLLPIRNYVLLKRFSSKEQKRRLYASVLLESELCHEVVGIENHVNYIHKPGGNLSVEEAFGIAAILNTAIVDNFFRSLNGNTQVSATEIRSLPFPAIEEIKRIGKRAYKSRADAAGLDADSIVAEVLGISTGIWRNRREVK